MRIVVAAIAVGAVVFGGVYVLTAERSPAPDPGAAPPAASAASGMVRRDQGEGGVDIEVTWGGPQAAPFEPDRYTVFLVALNTHSVDLSVYDMVRISELRIGGMTLRPLRWVDISDNSHHRRGVLIFPKIPSGQPVELVIGTIAGVPARTFRWIP